MLWKLQIKNHTVLYQTDAVNSIVDIFDGCQVKESLFTIDITQAKDYNKLSKLEGKGVSYELGYSNKCTIGEGEMLENVRKMKYLLVR